MLHEHHAAVPFRGLTRREALRQAGGIRSNEIENFSVDTTWVAAIARSGELLRVPVELYQKRYHSDNIHTKWAQWPFEKRIQAWTIHCSQMLEQAMQVEATLQERRLLWLVAVSRLVSPRTAIGYLPVASLTEMERQQLLDEFFNQVQQISKLDVTVWLETEWESIRQWTTGFYWFLGNESDDVLKLGKDQQQELQHIQNSKAWRLLVQWWNFRNRIRAFNPFN